MVYPFVCIALQGVKPTKGHDQHAKSGVSIEMLVSINHFVGSFAYKHIFMVYYKKSLLLVSSS